MKKMFLDAVREGGLVGDGDVVIGSDPIGSESARELCSG